jgi:myo-inositol-1(or 4)-monophosphatase
LRSYFGHVAEVQEKPDSSIVSEADRESERVIRKKLLEKLPEYSFWGEEGGLIQSDRSEGVWHVDPLDGTTNFVHGFPYYSTSIALEVKGEIVVAAVDAPSLGVSVWGSRGGGAYMNGRKLKVNDHANLHTSLLATGFSADREYGKQIEIFSHFLHRTRGIRRAGAAVLDLCYTAAGVFDIFWEQKLKPWDMATGVLLISEAGGTVTNVAGKRWTSAGDSILAGNPSLHKLMLQEIQQKFS